MTVQRVKFPKAAQHIEQLILKALSPKKGETGSLLIISGNIGAGKTTLATMIYQAATGLPMSVTLLEKDRLCEGLEEDPFKLMAFYTAVSRSLLHNDLTIVEGNNIGDLFLGEPNRLSIFIQTGLLTRAINIIRRPHKGWLTAMNHLENTILQSFIRRKDIDFIVPFNSFTPIKNNRRPSLEEISRLLELHLPKPG